LPYSATSFQNNPRRICRLLPPLLPSRGLLVPDDDRDMLAWA
jgi:hypothetical protein